MEEIELEIGTATVPLDKIKNANLREKTTGVCTIIYNDAYAVLTKTSTLISVPYRVNIRDVSDFMNNHTKFQD